MIPNALASTGPYADLWAHLKSIDHSLERALTPSTSLGELDRDRLQALAAFLRDTVMYTPVDDLSTIVAGVAAPSNQPSFTPDIDVRERLRKLQPFQEWHAASKKSADKKVERLLEAIDGYLQPQAGTLFPKDAPREEFQILHALLRDLMTEVQAAAHASL